MTTPFRTYRNPPLSLWQSSVASVIKKKALRRDLKAGANTALTRKRLNPLDPMMSGTVRYCDGISISDGKKQIMLEPKALSAPSIQEDQHLQAYLSSVHHQYAQAMIRNDTSKMALLEPIVKKYSVLDTGWLECVDKYKAYYTSEVVKPVYHDWKDKMYGNGDPNYSVIQWTLPANGRVAMIADWGTSQTEAIAVLQCACSFSPDAILNLGDTYYSGTNEECTDNILIPLSHNAVNPTTGAPIPVFNLPGNHDYYSGEGLFTRCCKM